MQKVRPGSVMAPPPHASAAAPWINARSRSAAASQVMEATAARHRSATASRAGASRTRSSTCSASRFASRGAKKSAASPRLSRCAGRSLSTTAVPAAAASTAGRPNPSASEGIADRQRLGVERGELVVRHEAGHHHAVVEAVRADPGPHRRRRRHVRLVAVERPGDDESRCGVERAVRQRVGVDQRLDVLVRADPAHVEEERLVRREARARAGAQHSVAAGSLAEERVGRLGHDREAGQARSRGAPRGLRETAVETVKSCAAPRTASRSFAREEQPVAPPGRDERAVVGS